MFGEGIFGFHTAVHRRTVNEPSCTCCRIASLSHQNLSESDIARPEILPVTGLSSGLIRGSLNARDTIRQKSENAVTLAFAGFQG